MLLRLHLMIMQMMMSPAACMQCGDVKRLQPARHAEPTWEHTRKCSSTQTGTRLRSSGQSVEKGPSHGLTRGPRLWRGVMTRMHTKMWFKGVRVTVNPPPFSTVSFPSFFKQNMKREEKHQAAAPLPSPRPCAPRNKTPPNNRLRLVGVSCIFCKA